VVALLVFGPGKLPEIGGALGRGIKDFRKAIENKSGDADAAATENTDDPSKA
jgi:sec-independent protein translocase protein TatA